MLEALWEGLGKTPQARVRSLLMIIGAITGFVVLTLNLRFGYNMPKDKKNPCQCTGWFIEWGPAADITVDIKKGS